MAKTVVQLNLSPVSAKWAHHHLGRIGEPSVYRTKLRKLINLLIEEKPQNPKNEEYHTDNHILIRLPNQIRPHLHSGRWREWWISPERMKQLDEFITAFWKHELTIMVELRKNQSDLTDLDVILDFHQLYDISDNDLSTDAALKIIQRARKKQREFYLTAV